MKKAKDEFVKYQMPEMDAPENYPEDYHLENGNYVNACIKCGKYFYGYKRRVICKVCKSK